MKNISGKITALFVIVGLIALWAFGSRIAEYNDAGNILFIQYPSGSLGIYSDQGFHPRWWGKSEAWKKSKQYSYSAQKDVGAATDQSVKVRFTDGSGRISGSIRYDLPTDTAKLADLYSHFRTEEAFEQQLVRPTIEKAIFMTGPLMTSRESAATKRPDLLRFIDDQATNGVYRTTQKVVDGIDELTGQQKKTTVTEIIPDTKDPSGFARQEESALTRFGIRVYNTAIDDVIYDDTTNKAIVMQQESLMKIQTAIAEARQSEQAVITAQKNGEAAAAETEWKQKTIAAGEIAKAEQEKSIAITKASQEKEVATTAAEQQKAVAELNLEAEKLNAQATLAKATAEAEGNRLKLQANGALEQKLATIEKIAEVQANALAQFRGNLVPSVVMGGGTAANGSTAGGFGTPELFNMLLSTRLAESLKQVGLDLSLDRTQAPSTPFMTAPKTGDLSSKQDDQIAAVKP